MHTSDDLDLTGAVAIIGMAGRFPGAANLDEFWDNLTRGVDSISRFADVELEPSRLEPPGLRELSSYVKARGVLDKVDRFDAGFFTIIPRDAAIMDPQHRIFLETAWAALECSGCDPSSYSKSIGIWAGMNGSTYYHENVLSRPDVIAQAGFLQTTMANGQDYLTTRASYKLNLRGPSVNVYATGATSLVAVCEAFSALVNHQCDIALAGGVSVTIPQRVGYDCRQGATLSPEGYCRPFDAHATGTVPGNGVGIVVLKRLEEALADGDFIYAVVRGVAVNNEGSRAPLASTSTTSHKAEVIAMAQAVAGVEPATISYVEGDGTANPTADRDEVLALSQIFDVSGIAPKSRLLGSVKGNIGHLDSAAGVAGLIKTALALHYQVLPPSLHFERPTQVLDSDQCPLLVNTEVRSWAKGTTPRRAGVNSFGSDGTNAHVVLEEAPRQSRSVSSRLEQLVVVSARTESSLAAGSEQLAKFLRTHPELHLPDVAHTLQSGRHAFPHRLSVVCTSVSDAAEALATKKPQRVVYGRRENCDGKVAFLFPGQGAQHVGMAAGLYRNEPQFAAEIDACARALQPMLGLDFRSLLYAASADREEAERRLAETAITQPVLFAVELALARLWMSWGVEPAAMIGHSLGEYVAACLAGVLPREQAAMIVATRGRLMQAQPRGAMMAVALSVSDLQPWLSSDVVIAAFNAPAFNVVAGPESAIGALQHRLSERNIRCRVLTTSHAFHSPMMEGALDPFRRELSAARLEAPSRPWISCVTGDWITTQQATDPEYWVRQLRQPVRFSDGVRRLVNDPSMALLEVGPGRALSTLVRQHTDNPQQLAVITCLDAESADDTRTMMHALGSLWVAGFSVNWAAHRSQWRGRMVPLPTYPFERSRYWVESTKPTTPVTGVADTTASASDVAASGSSQSSYAEPAEDKASTEDVTRTLRALLVDASGHASEAIGPSQTFLELGFDSLLLNQVTAALHKTFGVNVSLRQLLTQLSTLESLADHIHRSLAPSTVGEDAPEQRRSAGDRRMLPQEPPPKIASDSCANGSAPATMLTPVDFDPFADASVEIAYSLSEAQKEIWAVVQLGPEASCAYNQCFALTLRGEVSVDALKRATQRVFERHEALRTKFDSLGERQITSRFEPIDIPVLELHSGLSEDQRIAQVRAILDAEVRTPLDLVNGPCARVRVVLEASDCLHFVITAHHIVFDGSSFVLFFRELSAIYSEELTNTRVELPPAIPFRHHVEFEETPEGLEQARAALEYWRTQFADGAPTLELPTDHVRPPIKTYAGSREDRVLTRVTSQDVTRVASSLGATSVGLLLGVFQVLLYRLAGQSDLVVGLPLSARDPNGGDTVMGHATNLLPIRARIDGRASFSTLVRQVRTALLDGLEHQSLTFGTLVQALNVPRDMSRTPLVSAVFNVDRGRNSSQFHKSQADVTAVARTYVNFELELHLVDTRRELILELAYNSDLFSAESMSRWLEHYEELLAEALANPETPVGLLPLLGASDRDALLAWNRTEAPYPRDIPLAQLVEEQAIQTPDAVAVAFGEQTIRYCELNTRANQLAHALINRGVDRDQLVGICVERSIDMVVGLLAIVKAGGAYVPLDPSYPRERLAYMVQDAGLRLILSQSSLRSALSDSQDSVLCVDDPSLEKNARENPRVTVQPTDLAYVIYTSGSTGKPKGVAVPRGALVNFLWSMRNSLQLTNTDRVLAVTTISFDIAGLELWLPLLVGARIVVASRDDATTGARLSALVDQHRITFLQATPITWRLLLESGWQGNANLQVACGGEALPRDLAVQLAPIVRLLWNLYGPTETTVWSTSYLVRDGEAPILIGRPIANTQCHILDGNSQQVPIGAVGELYIGGAGVARGYLNRPDLTAERFVPDPFRTEPDATLYRTGDLARYLPDGNIICLGRTDHQVKIRGFRIELGEIESVLAQLSGVRQSAVIAREDRPGDARLVAYLTASNDARPDIASLREQLSASLPDYMIPQHFVFLDELPSTPNGKLDRGRLPRPADGNEVADAAAPMVHSPMEHLVQRIWAEYLGYQGFSLQGNFFEIGGNSLSAARIVLTLEKELGCAIGPTTLLQHPTVERLARALSRSTNTTLSPPLTTEGMPAVGDSNDSPCYFGNANELFGFCRVPTGIRSQELKTGVLFCQPIGQEYIRTHWTFRLLSNFLIQRGIPVFKFDYFGTGDSLGDMGDADLKRWSDDIVTAAAEFRRLVPIRQVSVVALRFGAILAVKAVEREMAVRDLVLWDPVVSGSRYLDELRCVQRGFIHENTEIYPFPKERQLEMEEDELVGFLYPPELKRQIAESRLVSRSLKNCGRVHVIVSEEREEYRAIGRELARTGKEVMYREILEAAEWASVGAIERALLPSAILEAISSVFSEKELA